MIKGIRKRAEKGAEGIEKTTTKRVFISVLTSLLSK